MKHFAKSSNVAKPTFCCFHSILQCFLVRVVGVWAVKAMSWHLVQAYGLESPYTHYFSLSHTRKHCRIEGKQQKVGFATFDNILQNVSLQNSPRTFLKARKCMHLHRKIVYMSHQSFLLHCSRRT